MSANRNIPPRDAVRAVRLLLRWLSRSRTSDATPPRTLLAKLTEYLGIEIAESTLDLRQQLVAKDEDLASLREMLDKYNDERMRNANELGNKNDELEAVRDDRLRLERANGDLLAKLQDAKFQNDLMGDEVRKSKDKVEKLNDELKIHKDELKASNHDRSQLEVGRRELLHQLGDLKLKSALFLQEKGVAEERIAELENENETLLARVIEFDRKFKHQNKLMEDLQQRMDVTRRWNRGLVALGVLLSLAILFLTVVISFYHPLIR